MIYGRHGLSERTATNTKTLIGAIEPRRRGNRHAPPVRVEFMPAVRFSLPIHFEFAAAHGVLMKNMKDE